MISEILFNFFCRHHLQNSDKSNVIEESSKEADGAFVKSDNQADLPLPDEVEVVPVRTPKRKLPLMEICDLSQEKVL